MPIMCGRYTRDIISMCLNSQVAYTRHAGWQSTSHQVLPDSESSHHALGATQTVTDEQYTREGISGGGRARGQTHGHTVPAGTQPRQCQLHQHAGTVRNSDRCR